MHRSLCVCSLLVALLDVADADVAVARTGQPDLVFLCIGH